MWTVSIFIKVQKLLQVLVSSSWQNQEVTGATLKGEAVLINDASHQIEIRTQMN